MNKIEICCPKAASKWKYLDFHLGFSLVKHCFLGDFGVLNLSELRKISKIEYIEICRYIAASKRKYLDFYLEFSLVKRCFVGDLGAVGVSVSGCRSATAFLCCVCNLEIMINSWFHKETFIASRQWFGMFYSLGWLKEWQSGQMEASKTWGLKSGSWKANLFLCRLWNSGDDRLFHPPKPLWCFP